MKKIKEVLIDNISEENLADLVSECNGWNGSFEHLERFDMEYDLDMFADGNNAHWLACRIHHGDFNPYHDYFNFDGYGNLQSFGEYEYYEMIKDEKEEIIETALELHEQGNVNVQWIIDEYLYD